MARNSFLSPVLLAIGLLVSLDQATPAQNYIALATGNADTGASDLHIVQRSMGIDATYHNVGWGAVVGQGAPYYSLRYGGYFKRQPHWGLEFNLNHDKAVLETDRQALLTGVWQGTPQNQVETIGNRVQRLRITNGVNTLALHLLYRTTARDTPSFPHGRLQFYAGIGPAFFLLHNSNTVSGISHNVDYAASGFGWSAFGGVRYGLAKKLDIYFEEKYVSATAKLSTANEGSIEAPLRSLHFQIGILHTF